MGTTCEGKVLHLIKKQLAADCAALEAGESVSLLAKWLPSVNAPTRMRSGRQNKLPDHWE